MTKFQLLDSSAHLSIQYRHAQDLRDDDATIEFPVSDTCALALHLPTPITFEKLNTHVRNVIDMCDIFFLELF